MSGPSLMEGRTRTGEVRTLDKRASRRSLMARGEGAWNKHEKGPALWQKV